MVIGSSLTKQNTNLLIWKRDEKKDAKVNIRNLAPGMNARKVGGESDGVENRGFFMNFVVPFLLNFTFVVK